MVAIKSPVKTKIIDRFFMILELPTNITKINQLNEIVNQKQKYKFPT